MSARLPLRVFPACLLVALAACGGGQGPTESAPLVLAPETAAGNGSAGVALSPGTQTSSCTNLPPLPSKPAGARSIASFGVVPSETVDSTTAIQAALDALKPGDWLVFPAGTYVHSKSLRVRVPGVVLWSEGATLLATNPDDTAIMLQADGVGMYKFRLHAVTTTRGDQMRQARIAVAPAGTGRVRGVVVRRNIVENAGPAGTPLANGSSATGIMVYRADGFVVAENHVERSLADAIHVTEGSINGRVVLNTAKQNGDDMIAVVSYLGSTGAPLDALLASLQSLRADKLVHNVVIAGNQVDGNYWGRGISVVGGEDITIDGNMVTNTTYAAGVLLAHESGYRTFGVRNVVVRNNTIQHVQTTAPAYAVGTAATAPRTGHAAIELHSLTSTDELANPAFAQTVAVQSVRVENNAIDDTLDNGIRIGVGGGPVGRVGLLNNRMTHIGGGAINVVNHPTPDYNVYCAGNTDDGNPTSSNLCMGAAPAVTGASLGCGGG